MYSMSSLLSTISKSGARQRKKVRMELSIESTTAYRESLVGDCRQGAIMLLDKSEHVQYLGSVLSL